LATLSSQRNRCTDSKGKVTYQDTPCASAASASAVDISEAFSTKPKAAATPGRVAERRLGGSRRRQATG